MSNPRHNKPAGERERARRAVELRVAGHHYQAIAAALGYRDESGARKAVNRLLSRREAESVAELRVIEGRRLDAIQAAVWDAASGGDTDAIRAVLGIMARRAKLFALDAPTAVAVGISETEFARQAAELLKVTGPGPLLKLARAEPIDAEVIAEAGESEPDGWSNIVSRPAQQPAAESPPEPEPQIEDDPEDGDLEPDEPEPYEAVVPLPTGMWRIAADQVPNRGYRYDPFRGVRWR